MTTTFQLDATVEKNFHVFWGNFPIPTLLLYKDRTILAVNKAAAAAGKTASPRKRCFEGTGGTEICSHCKANAAMLEKKGAHVLAYVPLLDQIRDAYWIPLEGQEDVYVHFGIVLNDYVSAELMSAKKAEAVLREQSRTIKAKSELPLDLG